MDYPLGPKEEPARLFFVFVTAYAGPRLESLGYERRGLLVVAAPFAGEAALCFVFLGVAELSFWYAVP